jgi:hypothetical protein
MSMSPIGLALRWKQHVDYLMGLPLTLKKAYWAARLGIRWEDVRVQQLRMWSHATK